jgi:DNA-nicking Smr family endonuclease
MARRRRELGDEERALWQKVTESVAPLPVRRRRRKPTAARGEEGLAEPPHDDAPVSTPPPKPVPPPRPEGGAAKPPAAAKKPSIRPLVPIDARTRRKIARGTIDVAARIDLHGLTQAEAFAALRAFLARTQMAGGRIAIVITGKGRPGAADLVFDPNERGVLRRVVPQWLSLPDLRDLVAGYEEAAPGHGGGGALYVRLRRPRHTTIG